MTAGTKIFDAVLKENYAQKMFCAILRHAKVTRFLEDELTLTFDSQPIAEHFEQHRLKKFEGTASFITGRKINVKIEIEE